MSSIKQRIQEIKEEIQKLRFDLTLKENVLKELELVSSRKRSKSTRKKSKPPRKGSLAEHIVNILNDSQSPMSVAQIVQKLKQQGFSSDAKVGLNNLVPSALGRRNDIFIKIKRGLYGLKSKHEQINQ